MMYILNYIFYELHLPNSIIDRKTWQFDPKLLIAARRERLHPGGQPLRFFFSRIRWRQKPVSSWLRTKVNIQCIFSYSSLSVISPRCRQFRSGIQMFRGVVFVLRSADRVRAFPSRSGDVNYTRRFHSMIRQRTSKGSTTEMHQQIRVSRVVNSIQKCV